MQITRKLLREWRACYTDQELAETVPEEGLTPIQVADMADVPVTDRIWVLLRPEVLGDALRPVLDGFVERAIRRVLGRSGVPEWEAWAEAWLSGDRFAFDAAYAAARSAFDAATGSAARSAAYAAWSDAAADAAAARSAAAYAARSAAAYAAWSAFDAARFAAYAAAYDDERTKQLADIRASLA